MRDKIIVSIFVLSVAIACSGQTAHDEKKLPARCAVTQREHSPLPKPSDHPFKYKRGDVYKRPPVVKFQVNENGTVSNVKIVRSSGGGDIDRLVLDSISTWKYKTRPGCGIVYNEMTVLIDWQ